MELRGPFSSWNPDRILDVFLVSVRIPTIGSWIVIKILRILNAHMLFHVLWEIVYTTGSNDNLRFLPGGDVGVLHGGVITPPRRMIN